MPAWAILFVSECVCMGVCVCPLLPHLGCVPAASALSLVTVVPGLCDDEPIEMQYGIPYPRVFGDNYCVVSRLAALPHTNRDSKRKFSVRLCSIFLLKVMTNKKNNRRSLSCCV